jgi:molybdopterin converting factor small subunit
MEIRVLFFGVLAEVTATSLRHYRGITSFEDLRMRIHDEFPSLIHYSYRIALNNEFCNGDPVLKDGDEIACIPPFSGG